jgi:hypothetical protein
LRQNDTADDTVTERLADFRSGAGRASAGRLTLRRRKHKFVGRSTASLWSSSASGNAPADAPGIKQKSFIGYPNDFACCTPNHGIERYRTVSLWTQNGCFRKISCSHPHGAMSESALTIGGETTLRRRGDGSPAPALSPPGTPNLDMPSRSLGKHALLMLLLFLAAGVAGSFGWHWWTKAASRRRPTMPICKLTRSSWRRRWAALSRCRRERHPRLCTNIHLMRGHASLIPVAMRAILDRPARCRPDRSRRRRRRLVP